VTNGLTGVIVPWGDVEGLTQALRIFVEDERMRVRFAEESRRRATRFGWPALAAKYLDLCTTVVTQATAQKGRSGASVVGSFSKDCPKEFRT
jgi:hypothetical protein